MMNADKQAEIMARYESVMESVRRNGKDEDFELLLQEIAQSLKDIPVMIKALEEANENLATTKYLYVLSAVSVYEENIKETALDRYRWKTRAEALENALGRITPRCPWCVLDRTDCGHYNPPMPHGTPRSDDPPFYCEHWQFNEERFTKELHQNT